MRLSTKVMIGVTIVITVVNVAVFYLMGHQYEVLLRQSLTDTARAFYKQVVILRAWVAKHGGVFVRYAEGMEANPYLEIAGTRTVNGDSLLLRNPAAVTRELSDMSSVMGERFRFHLTSLMPLNPNNAPNDFEREALTTLINGERHKLSHYGEFTRVEAIAGKPHFRYFAPLYTEESCLSCHGKQGYKVGDIRGGISILIPTDKVEAARKRNYMFMILGCLLSSSTISLLIYYFMRGTVITPLRRLEQAAASIGKGNYQTEISVHAHDEIGDLAKALAKMQSEIQHSVNQQIESEKMFALGQLSAGMAHEIRNPLFAIRNNLDYLKRHATDNSDQLEIYQEMEEGLQRMSNIVRAVLDYSRPHPPAFGNYHLRDVIDRCMALLGKQFRQENIEISVFVENNMPAIEMDIHRMEQVFVNLLTNARDAIRKKAVASLDEAISVREIKDSEGIGRFQELSHESDKTVLSNETGKIWITANRSDGFVRIQISDNGCGIKAADLPRIFDPFFTRSTEGTGLGLTIVRRIIEQHGGSIEVTSEEGEGTIFTLHLPIVQFSR
ncbi:MAG: DUF3365 domain-containing protein [candidate division KSB1 bacterium]|nr:DUF3365 domain-containing protein [candidate division KSB1 bacterium]MDZ7303744.1 DUF3365 domain-containing protein [candidate division KSB1 bacterium]MDZ7313119.1 DUF3365 domain-containing protein [candidate division KSB1 bacterium]